MYYRGQRGKYTFNFVNQSVYTLIKKAVHIYPCHLTNGAYLPSSSNKWCIFTIFVNRLDLFFNSKNVMWLKKLPHSFYYPFRPNPTKKCHSLHFLTRGISTLNHKVEGIYIFFSFLCYQNSEPMWKQSTRLKLSSFRTYRASRFVRFPSWGGMEPESWLSLTSLH